MPPKACLFHAQRKTLTKVAHSILEDQGVRFLNYINCSYLIQYLVPHISKALCVLPIECVCPRAFTKA